MKKWGGDDSCLVGTPLSPPLSASEASLVCKTAPGGWSGVWEAQYLFPWRTGLEDGTLQEVHEPGPPPPHGSGSCLASYLVSSAAQILPIFVPNVPQRKLSISAPSFANIFAQYGEYIASLTGFSRSTNDQFFTLNPSPTCTKSGVYMSLQKPYRPHLYFSPPSKANLVPHAPFLL
jgi:hypothetical protein